MSSPGASIVNSPSSSVNSVASDSGDVYVTDYFDDANSYQPESITTTATQLKMEAKELDVREQALVACEIDVQKQEEEHVRKQPVVDADSGLITKNFGNAMSDAHITGLLKANGHQVAAIAELTSKNEELTAQLQKLQHKHNEMEDRALTVFLSDSRKNEELTAQLQKLQLEHDKMEDRALGMMLGEGTTNFTTAQTPINANANQLPPMPSGPTIITSNTASRKSSNRKKLTPTAKPFDLPCRDITRSKPNVTPRTKFPTSYKFSGAAHTLTYEPSQGRDLARGERVTRREVGALHTRRICEYPGPSKPYVPGKRAGNVGKGEKSGQGEKGGKNKNGDKREKGGKGVGDAAI